MINTRLQDGRGKSNYVKVNGEGELSVVVHPHPPRDEEIEALPYRNYFQNSGSNDMTVNGATNYIDFIVEANELTGVKEFSISWARIRITLCQASISFCSISDLIS